MYNDQIEALISAALADGTLTEKEKQILFKKAQAMGIDLDEFEMVLDARLVELKKAEKEKAAQSAPKSNKYGDVRKCPVCGAIVQAYLAKCPECGYEFSNVDANLSSKKLAEEITNAKTEADKKQCITLFPIPNTKSDLLEFLTSLQPKMRDISDPLSSAYFKKYEECIAKAKVSFANDPVITPFIDAFEKERKAIKRKQSLNSVKRWCGKHKILTFVIILFTAILISYAIDAITPQSEKNNFSLCKNAVIEALKNNNVEHAQQLVENFKYTESKNALYAIIIQSYLENGQLENAKELAESNPDDETYEPIYNYLIDHELYDEAEKYIAADYYWHADYLNYMKNCVSKMLEHGQKSQARKFVARKVTYFAGEGSDSSFNVAKVKKELNSIIDSY